MNSAQQRVFAHSTSLSTWQRFVRHRLAFYSTIVLIVLATLAFAAPLIAQALAIDPNRVQLLARFDGPSAQHWLGTDELGRDLLLRLLYGARVSLIVGLSGALLAGVLGTLVGLSAGYFGGYYDAIVMRFTDLVIGLPALPLLIVLAAVDWQKLGLPAHWLAADAFSVIRIILIVALFGWTLVARLVRSAVLRERERDYVHAARSMGAGALRVMVVHLLPNVLSPVIIAMTLSVGQIILLESVLSFLGLGVQLPVPSWGNMLTNAQELIWTAPVLAIYPGLLIFVTVIAFNFAGDGLQDILEPRTVRP